MAAAVLAVFIPWLSTVVGEKFPDAFAQQVITATDLARDMLERIKSADYDTIVPTNYPQENYGSIAAHSAFRRIVTINEARPDPHTKTVTVTVSWHDDAGIAHHVPLSTIMIP